MTQWAIQLIALYIYIYIVFLQCDEIYEYAFSGEYSDLYDTYNILKEKTFASIIALTVKY